jgi:hypothetical protein
MYMVQLIANEIGLVAYVWRVGKGGTFIKSTEQTHFLIVPFCM